MVDKTVIGTAACRCGAQATFYSDADFASFGNTHGECEGGYSVDKRHGEAIIQHIDFPPKPKGAAQLAYNIQLRDMFAMHLMPTLMQLAPIMATQQSVTGHATLDMGVLAKKAYELADIMIKARGE